MYFELKNLFTGIQFIFLIFLLLPTIVFAQSDTLLTLYEFNSPSLSPWGLTYDGENFFNSDDSLGVIYKINTEGIVLETYNFPNKHLKGMTFHEGDLWVVNDFVVDDTVSILKIDTDNGTISDSITFIAPDIWGIGSYQSMLYVSYNGGWGPCTLEIDPLTKKVTGNLCCAHPCGLTNINKNLWCVRMNSENGPGNYIRELEFFYWENDTQEKGLEEIEPRYILDCYATDLTFDGENIWVCDYTNKKIKKLSKIILTNVTDQSNDLPVIFNLEQNYPNPFNTSTTIKFSIPSDSFVILSIYNIVGKKIRELVCDAVSMGIHSVVWDGRCDNSNIVSSGVYIYKLSYGNQSETKYMLLIK